MLREGGSTMGDLARIYRRLIDEVWHRGNLGIIDELISPDYITHDPSAPPQRGPQAMKAVVETLKRAIPDVEYDILDIVEEGDRVASRWCIRGTVAGGQALSIFGMSFNRFEGGTMVEGWMAWDRSQLPQPA
jgi:predicted SnoaL-like aldol condensation-catalyzing enzyme